MTNSFKTHSLAIVPSDALAIVSGAVTITQLAHTISAETGTTDDLNTISIGYTKLTSGGVTYRPLLCLTAAAGHTITLKHGAGNIDLPDDTDVSFADDENIWLLYNGTNWRGFRSAISAGEANTASNVGAGGVGVYKQKTGVDLEFKNINAGSAKITVTDDVPNNEVDIDLGTVDFSDLNTKTHTHQDAANGGQLDHGAALSGLADDDHTQYALLAGRSGGQTLIGGTGAGDDLTLQTTSNGTKGSYILSDLTTDGPMLTTSGVVSTVAQLTLEDGGTEGDLSATGPGLVQQATAGAALSILANGTALQQLRINAGGTAPEWATISSGGAAFNHRQGLAIRYNAAAILAVDTGSVVVGSTLVEKTTSTLINLATAANWIGGSSLEAASSWVNVYADASGNILLHDTLPIYPVAATASRVATMQVNQAGWNGTAGQGLNATTITYDNDSGEGSIAVGMYVIIADDSACTTGRGKGTGAAASKNDLSLALITAVDTGANTITVAAGHQIAINDDDYLFVVEAGAPIFNYISSTWYRWLGAIWNDGSSNLNEDIQAERATYTLDEGSDYSTTSTSFALIDSTNLNLPILALDGDVIDTRFSGAVSSGSSTEANRRIYGAVSIDGSMTVGNDGNSTTIVSIRTYQTELTINRQDTVLPGSHQVALWWKGVAAVGYTLFAGAGTSGADVHPQMTVEVR